MDEEKNGRFFVFTRAIEFLVLSVCPRYLPWGNINTFFLFLCIFLTNWQVAVKSYDTKYFPGGEKKQTKGDKHTTQFWLWIDLFHEIGCLTKKSSDTKKKPPAAILHRVCSHFLFSRVIRYWWLDFRLSLVKWSLIGVAIKRDDSIQHFNQRGDCVKFKSTCPFLKLKVVGHLKTDENKKGKCVIFGVFYY